MYECIIAYVKTPNEETTVIIEEEDKGKALVKNDKLRPGTYVKAIREIGPA